MRKIREVRIDMAKVSIIIPIYNEEKYLEQCLDSICGQTWKETEIICIDDGSTDNSPRILESYAKKDSRIKIITQKNKFAGVPETGGWNARPESIWLFWMRMIATNPI